MSSRRSFLSLSDGHLRRVGAALGLGVGLRAGAGAIGSDSRFANRRATRRTTGSTRFREASMLLDTTTAVELADAIQFAAITSWAARTATRSSRATWP